MSLSTGSSPADDPIGPLRETVRRVSELVPAQRTVTVIGHADRAFVPTLQQAVDPGTIVKEPVDRGTAPATLLGLARIVDRDPNACVLIAPADHELRDTYQFRFSVRATASWIRAGHAPVVLFGVKPTRAGAYPSWITPAPTGRRTGPRQLQPIASLVDQASPGDLAELSCVGAVWNTHVIMARAGALLDLYERHLPDLFHAVLDSPDSPGQPADEDYAALRRTDLTRDVLRSAGDLSVYVWPGSIGWVKHMPPQGLDAWKGARPRRPRLAPVLDWAPARVRRAFGA